MLGKRDTSGRKDEHGTIITLVAVFMLFVVGAMAALSIDTVTIYTARSEAQLAADAAALAAARVIANSGATSDSSGASLEPWRPSQAVSPKRSPYRSRKVAWWEDVIWSPLMARWLSVLPDPKAACVGCCFPWPTRVSPYGCKEPICQRSSRASGEANRSRWPRRLQPRPTTLPGLWQHRLTARHRLRRSA